MLLKLENVGRSVGPRTLFRGVSLEVRPGDRIGLVGANGAGKTTLLRIAAGDDPPDEGRVSRRRGVRVGMLRQEIDPARGQSVREEVGSVYARLDALEAEIRELEREMAAGGEPDAALAERYDRARADYELAGGFERASRVERVLAGLGFDAAAAGRPLSSFSGGWLMRVELAKLLLDAPDVLLLDEPTNHLDLPSIQWFEETLEGYRGAAVIISHDRAFLRRHVGRVAELARESLSVFEGGFDGFLAHQREERERLVAMKRAQDRQVAKTERFIERFRAKNTKATQVQSRVKALAKLERVALPETAAARMRLRIPKAARAGREVLRLRDVHKRYGETVVYQGIDFLVERGDRIALVGPNGAGKSTLLRIAAGVLAFDAGERVPGHNVEVAFFAQHQLESLAPGRTVLEELESVAGFDDVPRLRGHLGAFLFPGDDVGKRVEVLSGGEKARLALAKMLLRPANFLVLDEPTNHLDLAGCEVLEQALRDYDGTLLFISHDRDFIDALANRVVEVRAGHLAAYPGNHRDYRRAVDGRASGAAPPPAGPATPAEKRARHAERDRARDRARRAARARRRLEALEEEIGGLEIAAEELETRLADPAVYRDGEAVRAVESERAATQEALEARYAEWEALAAELEEEPAD